MGQNESIPELKQGLLERKFKLYIKKGCPYSERAMKLLHLTENDTDNVIVFNPKVDKDYNIQKEEFRLAHEDLHNLEKDYTFPCIFDILRNPPFIGGCNALERYLERF
jgi:glutaredoxin